MSHEGPVTDSEAMEAIHQILDRPAEWSSDEIEEVAAVVEATGRHIRDPNFDDYPEYEES